MTLDELNTLVGERAGLFDKISAATLVTAEAYRANVSATAAQKAWAKSVFEAPAQVRDAVYNAVLAANAGATITAVRGASDTAVQTAVNNAAVLFAG